MAIKEHYLIIDKELKDLHEKYKETEKILINQLYDIKENNKIEKTKKLNELIQVSKILYKIYKLNNEIEIFHNKIKINNNQQIKDTREVAQFLYTLNKTFIKEHSSKLISLICSSLGTTKKELNNKINEELNKMKIYIDI